MADPIAGNTANASGAPMTNFNNAGGTAGVTTIFQAQCYYRGAWSTPGVSEHTGILSGAEAGVRTTTSTGARAGWSIPSSMRPTTSRCPSAPTG